MNLNIVKVGIALFLFVGAVAMTTAQDTQKTTHKHTRTLTGCIQKGEGAGEYNLITAKGATWELTSETVKLEDHVGHTVKVVGTVFNAKAHGMKEDVKDEMKEHGVHKNMAEHGHLMTSELTMVSEKCSK